MRGLSEEEIRKWTASFLETDKSQEIPAERAELIRAALIHTGEGAGELVWSFRPSVAAQEDARRIIEELRSA